MVDGGAEILTGKKIKKGKGSFFTEIMEMWFLKPTNVVILKEHKIHRYQTKFILLVYLCFFYSKYLIFTLICLWNFFADQNQSKENFSHGSSEVKQ